MSRFLVVCCIVFVFGSAGVVSAGEADRIDPAKFQGGDKLEALIAAVTERQQEMKTLQTAFVQTKESLLLTEASEAHGIFSYSAPGNVCWDFETPVSMKVVINGETVTTYHPNLKRAEQIKVSAQHKTLLNVLAGQISLDDMQARFSIVLVDRGGSEDYRLTLKPLRRMMKKRLTSIYVEIDRELLLPVVVEYLEADGDLTRYVFDTMVVDSQLEEALFELELGDDVLVEFIDASSGQS